MTEKKKKKKKKLAQNTMYNGGEIWENQMMMIF